MADNASNDTSLQSTKQMLDELDALMERMLSLPVNELGETPAFPEDVVQESTGVAALTLLEAEPPPEPEATSVAPPTRPNAVPTQAKFTSVTSPAPSGASVETAPPPAKPLERRARTKSALFSGNGPHFTIPSKPTAPDVAQESVSSPPTPEPVSELQPLTNDVIPPSVLSDLAPLLAQVPVVASSPPARRFTPLLWINQVFDGVMACFGGPGAWLRSLGGRMVLGFSGIALFLAAVGWVVMDFLGWNW